MNVKFDEVSDNFTHFQKSGDENRYYSKKAFTYDDILLKQIIHKILIWVLKLKKPICR